jgi:predicted AAA+ superfamily ATPase
LKTDTSALRDTPVVCLLGPRQSGKTTLARMLGPRYAYVTFVQCILSKWFNAQSAALDDFRKLG